VTVIARDCSWVTSVIAMARRYIIHRRGHDLYVYHDVDEGEGVVNYAHTQKTCKKTAFFAGTKIYRKTCEIRTEYRSLDQLQN